MKMKPVLVGVLLFVFQVAFSGIVFADYSIDTYVNVKDFGAVGDGVTDDTAAIQSAIDSISTSNTNETVYFPSGIYIVSPTTTKRIEIRSNVHITGSPNATIKVKDNAGDYETIFGPETNDTYVENVTISNITIDQNGKNNTSCYVDTKAKRVWYQYAIAVYKFKNIVIDNVRFDTCSGVNAITLNGADSSCAVVKNCYFKFVRTKGTATYDNSAVYFNCADHYAYGNLFYADIAEKAYGAIETHDGPSVISGNISDGYQTGVNIVSASASDTSSRDTSDITVIGNTFSRANMGISLWSITGKKLNNVTIANNTISIANVNHNMRTNFGISMILDGVNNTLNGSHENITITGNTITFQIEPQKRDIQDSMCFAIGIAPNGNVSNINIANNIITNAPVAGIKIGLYNKSNKFENINVKNNLIVNAGIYQKGIRDYCSAVFMVGNLNNVFIEDNTISDTFDTMMGNQSFYTLGQFTNTTIKNNKVSTKQGGYLSSSNATGLDMGIKVSTYYSDVFPLTSKLSVEAGDIIINTGELTPGSSYYGYVVVTPGTFGTLEGITAVTSAGSNVITVNDVNKVRVGDYITLEGGNEVAKVIYASGNTLKLNTSISTTLTNAKVYYRAPDIIPFAKIEQQGKLNKLLKESRNS